MSFPDALSTCLRKYATFAGRARRAEYWQFTLAYVVALVAAALVDQVWAAPVLTALVIVGLLLPHLAVTVRRLHDTGRSGAWFLISLVPFGGLVLLVFTCQDSAPVANEYGASPKHIAAHRAAVHA
jgi:uncharacterized membrane protein YhaH (DUF805 family)